jgi:hypothetical protein
MRFHSATYPLEVSSWVRVDKTESEHNGQFGRTLFSAASGQQTSLKCRDNRLRDREIEMADVQCTEMSVHEEPQENDDWDRNAYHPKD